MSIRLVRPRGHRLAVRAVTLLLALVSLAGTDAVGKADYRSIDGTGNNTIDPYRGAAGMPLLRLTPHAYADYVAEPSGMYRPSAREVSNAINAETHVVLNAEGGSDYVWLWGQFLDHDIDLTPGANPAEPMHIEVPRGDPFFDPHGTGYALIEFTRSIYDPDTGWKRNNPRRQLNMITSWIDASNVYGSDEERARALRKNDGSGELLTSAGDLLPYNTPGLDNAGGPSPDLYLAGDVRANEQVSLTAMHALWVREHNRLAREFRARYPRLSGDEIYERARQWVGALVQVITYNEFLPVLLGPTQLPHYKGWEPRTDGSITNEFSTAAYRFGHSMVSSMLLRRDRYGNPVAQGDLPLRNAFFAPHEVRLTGIEPILRGLAYQQAREVDTMVVDDLRNFLFGPPGAGGFDLASLNIQRGRDHGLDDLNETRMFFGMKPYRDWHEITRDGELARALEDTYGDIHEIDLWVGGLAEDHLPGTLFGPTFHEIICDQFRRLRDGDRHFYKKVFHGAKLRRLEKTTLADVIRRNTDIGGEIPDNVFYVR